MTELELSREQQSIIDKVVKLLALSNANANENEASAASAKAMELLEAYNLDMAIVNSRDTSKSAGGKRDDKTLKGGLYSWQRDLWDAVARLHFCQYYFIRGLTKGSAYQHQLIGSPVNVVGSRVMAEYLQQTVERLAREYAATAFPGYSIFIRELIAFREGVAQRLTERLWQERRDRLAAEKAKEAEARARAASGAPSDGKGLVLASVIQTEADYNNDYINGWEPGTTARRRAEDEARRAAAMARYEEEMRKQRELEERNPAIKQARLERERREEEEERKREEKRRKREERNAKRRKGDGFSYRKPTAAEERQQMSTYATGYRKGDEVSLNKQVDEDRKGRIGHG